MSDTKREIPNFLKPWINKKVTLEEIKGLCFRAFDGTCLYENCALWMNYICLCDFKTKLTPYSVGARIVEVEQKDGG